MSILRAALLLAVLGLPIAAPAATLDEISGKTVALTLADAMISRRPLMIEDSVAATAAQAYFDADAVLSLGALALAIGGLAAFGRRLRSPVPPHKVPVDRWSHVEFARPRDAA